jgi:hypothetical protein
MRALDKLGSVILNNVLGKVLPALAVKLANGIRKLEAESEKSDNPYDDLASVALGKLIILIAQELTKDDETGR